jgi:hypothetical protein
LKIPPTPVPASAIVDPATNAPAMPPIAAPFENPFMVSPFVSLRPERNAGDKTCKGL